MKKRPTQLPKRSSSHKTETKAVDQVKHALGENFLFRQQTERDYGIDAHIERFEDEYPTGDVLYAQIKGTNKNFDSTVKYENFPVKTLNYASLFSIPFFIFYASTTSKKTKFLWIQKYIDSHLKKNKSNFENQETLTIEFPEENNLEDNSEKLINIIQQEKHIRVGLKFLTHYRRLCNAYEDLKKGKIEALQVCIREIMEIMKSEALHARVDYNEFELTRFDIEAVAHLLNDIEKSNNINENQIKSLDRLLFPLKFVELDFLNLDATEKMNSWLFKSPPY